MAASVPPCARTIPAARLLAPLPRVADSTSTTDRPASARKHAVHAPTVPPPMTTTSALLTARCCPRLNVQSTSTVRRRAAGPSVRVRCEGVPVTRVSLSRLPGERVLVTDGDESLELALAHLPAYLREREDDGPR